MTRETLKDLLPIIQAFVDGKKIEYSNDGEDWIETETPTWDTDYVYRIKPEPKYRLFKSQEECWQEMHKHPDFGWIRNTVTNNISQVLRISDNVVDILSYSIITRTFEFAFQSFKFTDGKPFGIKEE